MLVNFQIFFAGLPNAFKEIAAVEMMPVLYFG